jgi:hypothetical protein
MTGTFTLIHSTLPQVTDNVITNLTRLQLSSNKLTKAWGWWILKKVVVRLPHVERFMLSLKAIMLNSAAISVLSYQITHKWRGIMSILAFVVRTLKTLRPRAEWIHWKHGNAGLWAFFSPLPPEIKLTVKAAPGPTLLKEMQIFSFH